LAGFGQAHTIFFRGLPRHVSFADYLVCPKILDHRLGLACDYVLHDTGTVWVYGLGFHAIIQRILGWASESRPALVVQNQNLGFLSYNCYIY
jgi:hypothetical protein